MIGLAAAVLAGSATGATSSCDYGASPPAALRPLLQAGGFTYGFLHCTRFGIAYYAFADNTFDARHPTLTERVLVVAATTRKASAAFAYFRSRLGRAGFLQALKAFVTRFPDQYTRTVQLLRISRVGKIVRLEAIAHASLH